MLPLRPARICSSVASGNRLRKARTAITNPGVQKPHCWASCSTNACGTASSARLSTVVISLPTDCQGERGRAIAGLPSTMTVLAPLLPSDAHRFGARKIELVPQYIEQVLSEVQPWRASDLPFTFNVMVDVPLITDALVV